MHVIELSWCQGGSRDVKRASAYISIFNNHFNKGKNKLLWYELIKCDIKCIEIHGSSEALVSPFSLKHFKSKTNKDSSVGERDRNKKREMIEMGCLKARKYLWLLIKLKAILNVLRVVWGRIEHAWRKMIWNYLYKLSQKHKKYLWNPASTIIVM